MTDWYGKPAGPGDPPGDEPPPEPAPPPVEADEGELDDEDALDDGDDGDDADDAALGSEPGILPGHQPLTPEGSGCCCGLVFGLLLLIPGLAALAHTQGALVGFIPDAAQALARIDEGTRGLRLDLIAWCAAILGVLALANTLGSSIRASRKRWAVVNRPEEPWQHDHPWDPERGKDRAHAGPSSLLGLAGIGLFLAPFHILLAWIGFEPEGAIIGWIVLGLFDLIIVAATVYLIYTILRSLKYAGAELRWPQFPLMVGQPVTFRFTQPPALQRLVDQPALQVALRCLHDVTITTGSGKNRTVKRVVKVLHELPLTVPPGSADEDGKVELSFQLPPGAPATDLVSSDPTYWELEIKAETPGIDYLGQYLVPIY